MVQMRRKRKVRAAVIVGASRRINTWWVLETDVCILSVQAMLALGVGMAKIHGLGG